MQTLQLFSSILCIWSLLIRFSYKSQCNSRVFGMAFIHKSSNIFPLQSVAVLGLDPDQDCVHVGFPPGAPDSFHSLNTCMFNEATTLNCVFVSVLAQG